MDKLAKVRAEVARIQLYTQSEVLKQVLDYIDKVQEEPVSIWHNENQQPTMYRKYLVRYSDGRISGSWERHDDGFIPWKDVVKEHKFTHWCYVEDLIKL